MVLIFVISTADGNHLTLAGWGLGGGYQINRFHINGGWYNTNGSSWQLVN